jgi:hyperosmotically inducible protein
MKARPLHLLGLFAIGAAAGACAAPATPAPTAPPVQPPAAARLTMTDNPDDGGVVPDAWIVAVLRRELAADAVLSGQVVGIDAVLGVVNLEGSVDAPLAKRRAVEIARVVRGVRAIVDRIEIAPHPLPDYELEFAVAAALSADPVTSGQRIAARAHEAVVLLSGDVGSEAERRIAEADVLSVPGVVDVIDDLAVRPRRGEDRRSAAAAVRLLHDDPWLDDSRVGVEAGKGVVQLSGWVGSAQEWARAERDAAQAAPRGAVDVAALRIGRWIDDGTLRGRPLVARSDGDVGQALLDAFVRDPRVHPFMPTVDVHDGVVILTGVAPSQEAARAATEDARNVLGASAVRGDINAAPSVVSQSDADVRAQIIAALQRDPALARQDIVIQVVGGRVFLRGRVATQADRANVIALATSAPGARDVHDGLVLGPPRLGVTSSQPRSPR